MKVNILLVFFLWCVSFVTSKAYAQDLNGTTWTVITVASEVSTKTLVAGEQILEILEDGTYSAQNFLGITEQSGNIISNENTLVLGKESGYFAVFSILENLGDSLKIKYLPYELSATQLNITLTKHKTETEESETTDAGSDLAEEADFSGKWTFSQGNLKLELEFEQNGTELTGIHCSGEDCTAKYQIKGAVSGQVATISLLNDAGEEQATAQAQSLGGSISWGITSDISKVETVDSVVLKKVVQ